ncbi:probable WRKY transcription factor 75 [Zingiber officinale]|uniref:probable WRKY transcription factor 75 n=1 Tax=Zingiber officinale TaxID=94328 RepID=UPI001C4AAC14|nr:probable WRKY transcription factor 75 [Zingiber officinale]
METVMARGNSEAPTGGCSPSLTAQQNLLMIQQLAQQQQVQEQSVYHNSLTPPALLMSEVGLASLLLPSLTGQQLTAAVAPPQGDDEGEVGGVCGRSKAKSAMTTKGKKVMRPRFAFRTKSPSDILDDGYRWRKYGQKAVKNSPHPRSYYRCTHHTCNVKKQVQRQSKDTSVVVTTYEGIHNHPCEKLMEAFAPLLKQIQFLTGL